MSVGYSVVEEFSLNETVSKPRLSNINDHQHYLEKHIVTTFPMFCTVFANTFVFLVGFIGRW